MTEHQTANDKTEDIISITAILKILWGYRGAILGSFIVVLFLFCAGSALLFFALPSQRLATMTFRIQFEGAEKGTYPNGSTFNPADIISTPILSTVYEANNLKQYLSFEKFKNTIFIHQTNKALQLLEEEYSAMLADRKLSLVDRQRIETDFREKQKSLYNQQYSLQFSLEEHFASMPEKLISKVLADVLATWAEEAELRKGAFKYRIPVYSRNIIQAELIEAEDYIVSIDILRSKIEKVLDNISALSALPGAKTIRIGKEDISLAEIETTLQDISRFKLEPLIGLIRATGLSKDPDLAVLYLKNQLFKLQMDLKEGKERITLLESALSSYMEKKMVAAMTMPTMAGITTKKSLEEQNSGNMAFPTYIPQFGDSFLDRLVAMTTQSKDIQYRQDTTNRIIEEGMRIASFNKRIQYYESLIKSFENTSPIKPEQVLSKAVESTKSRFTEIESIILKSLDQINAIYLALSKHNLNPQTMLFKVTEPLFITDQQAISYQKLALAGVFLFLMVVLLAPVSCLIHHSWLKEDN